MSRTSSNPPRSWLPESSAPGSAHLSTKNGLLDSNAARMWTCEAPALPFIINRIFRNQSTTQYHLFPGQFPDIEEDLGHGASFLVQRATLPDRRDITSGMKICVALKRIRPNSQQSRQSFQSVLLDLLCLSHPTLQNHGNIVDLLGIGWELSPTSRDPRLWPYLVLEYAPYGSLSSLQDSGRILTYAEKKKYCLEVADGLGALHFANIAHGDVKTENILIFNDSDGGLTAKLSDFGYATVDVDFHTMEMSIDDTPTEIRVRSGTPPWTAPEYGEIVPWGSHFKADVYSWGLLTWRVFIDGANPFIEYKSRYEELGGNIGKTDEENIQHWKLNNTVLKVAKSFGRMVSQPQREISLEEVFEWSLHQNSGQRDLVKASIPWRFGVPDAFAQYPIKLPLSRRFVFAGSTAETGLLEQPFTFQQLQMFPVRLRDQFLQDLRNLAQLESPLPQVEAHLCPTVTATIIIAEQSLLQHDFHLAFDFITRAARKGLIYAKSLSYKLRKFKESHFRHFPEVPANQEDLPGSDIATTEELTNEEAGWLYEAATVGSTSALLDLEKADHALFEDALRTLQQCRLGGIQHLSMWTTLDTAYSQSINRLTAAPKSSQEGFIETLTREEDDENQWIYAGPEIGRDISFLHAACAKDTRNAVLTALNRGDAVDSTFSPGGETPLLLACINGSIETVKTLLDHGANPCIADVAGETPLHWLSSFDAEIIPHVARLLCRDVKQLALTAVGSFLVAEGYCMELGLSSGTPLHRAVGKRNIHAVRALLELGADPLAIDSYGVTSVGRAAQFHLAEILELLHSKASSCIPNQNHGTDLRLFNFAINAAPPLQQVNIHGKNWHKEMERTLNLLLNLGENLYSYGGEDNFLRNAIGVGNHRMVKFLLESGAMDHINTFDIKFGGFPALYHAVEFGNTDIFTTLLESGADTSTLFVPDILRQAGTMLFMDNRPNRSTYLHVCAEAGSSPFFVRTFLNCGVPVNQPDADWHTAFFLAVRAGYTDIASILLEHGANVKEVLDGRTLVGQLAKEGFSLPRDRFQYLLSKLPDNQAVKFLVAPRARQSIFHLLAQDSRTIRQPSWARDLLRFFLDQVKHHEILDIQDVHLNTALHFAIESSNIEVLIALLEAGANPNLQNHDNKTPLALATDQPPSRKRSEAINLLQLHGASLRGQNPNDAGASSQDIWKELGWSEQGYERLDTAMIYVLQQLQDELRVLLDDKDFLSSENPWKPVSEKIYHFIRMNPAILANPDRIRDFELATTTLLQGFSDAISVELEGNNLVVKLGKPRTAVQTGVI